MKKVGKILFIALLVIMVLGTFSFLWNKSKKKTVEYETVKPEYRTIEKVTIITGTLEPRNEIELKPQISGIITAIYKEPGERVKAGEVIAKVQVVPDISQLSSAESQLKIAEINMEKAKNDFERVSKLFQSNVVSREEYDNSQISYKTAVENVNNAKESIQIIKEGISNNTALYSNTQIKSTISGTILDIPVKVGNSVIQSNNFNDGTTIATIANMNDLIFKGKVDETEVGKIAIGNPVKLMIGAMQEEQLEAELEYISPKGSLSNGATLFEIKAAVKLDRENSKNAIRSGYSANGEIVLDKKENVNALPESSIQFEGDSTFIYISQKSGRNEVLYTRTPVQLGLSDGIYVEILSPLDTSALVRGKVKTMAKTQFN